MHTYLLDYRETDRVNFPLLVVFRCPQHGLSRSPTWAARTPLEPQLVIAAREIHSSGTLTQDKNLNLVLYLLGKCLSSCSSLILYRSFYPFFSSLQAVLVRGLLFCDFWRKSGSRCLVLKNSEGLKWSGKRWKRQTIFRSSSDWVCQIIVIMGYSRTNRNKCL